ncbi:chemotaxis protein CheV [Arcobacter sp.]|uniref:chemotaxis protein CheV n=1 Tax=Arcobacter sp. TaxID=1872629 RepID=UPI003D0A505B
MLEEHNEQDNNIYSDIDDELIRLVTSNADASSQYVVFRNCDDELFAINVAKVEELIVFDSISMAKNSASDSIILGVSKIRDNINTIVLFDRWLGRGEKSLDEYELVMVCNYGSRRIGIVIKNVVTILNIDAEKLDNNSDRDPKTAYICEIIVDGSSRLCSVFDSDKMLFDIFPDIEKNNESVISKVTQTKNITKEIVIAEDSKIIQMNIASLLTKMGVKYSLFANGKEAYDYLLSKSPDEIALIVSDIEMPIMDGLKFLAELKKHKEYEIVPFIVHTNMANTSLSNKAKDLGANWVISKPDTAELEKRIQEFARE